MFLNFRVWKYSSDPLWLQGDPTSPSYRRSVLRFIRRTDVEAETPIHWPPDTKSWLIWKDPDDEKDWGQEEKGTTENEMVRWHNRLNGHLSKLQELMMDREAWRVAVLGVAKSQTWLSDWTELNSHIAEDPLEPQRKPKNTGVHNLSFLQWISWPRSQTRVSCIAGGFFTNWAIREISYKWNFTAYGFLYLVSLFGLMLLTVLYSVEYISNHFFLFPLNMIYITIYPQ